MDEQVSEPASKHEGKTPLTRHGAFKGLATAARITLALMLGLLVVNQTAFAQADKPKIIHDAEYYVLVAQHGQKWGVEDKELDTKLAELRKKFGMPPNIIHVMWDDTAGILRRLAIRAKNS